MCSDPYSGRHDGHCGLAAEPGPRKVRGGIPRQRDRRTVLPSLTPEDLKELGVASLDTAESCSMPSLLCAPMRAARRPPLTQRPRRLLPSGPPEDRAERRQVTVMFSDLVGSTALSARMDPEDLREVISAYQKCVAETVGRFGGFVAKYMGDGVLIYSAIRRPTRTMQSEPYARGWS